MFAASGTMLAATRALTQGLRHTASATIKTHTARAASTQAPAQMHIMAHTLTRRVAQTPLPAHSLLQHSLAASHARTMTSVNTVSMPLGNTSLARSALGGGIAPHGPQTQVRHMTYGECMGNTRAVCDSCAWVRSHIPSLYLLRCVRA